MKGGDDYLKWSCDDGFIQSYVVGIEKEISNHVYLNFEVSHGGNRDRLRLLRTRRNGLDIICEY
jgi:hypothetical protein